MYRVGVADTYAAPPGAKTSYCTRSINMLRLRRCFIPRLRVIGAKHIPRFGEALPSPGKAAGSKRLLLR